MDWEKSKYFAEKEKQYARAEENLQWTLQQ